MDIDKLRNIAATLAISYDPAISDEDIATISDAADEIERLRAALLPFAKARDAVSPYDAITLGDLSRAKAALRGEEE